MNRNYYEILGVSQDSTQEEIRAAYRKQAFKYHPDRNTENNVGSDSKMKELNFIYSILSDPIQRKTYDETTKFDSDFESYKSQTSYSYVYVFCTEIEIEDSQGNTSIISKGQNIYYLVEIDKSIITWKYKSKEYFNLIIKEIFDPEKKDSFSQTIKYDLKKTPLFLVHIGEKDMIIYQEDFQNHWISERTYRKMDKKSGVITGIIVAVFLLLGGYYFYQKFKIPEKTKFLVEYALENKYSIYEEDIDFLKTEYSVSEKELKYIDTDYYLVCEKTFVQTKEEIELLSIPDTYGINTGDVPDSVQVEVFLYCPSKNAYKIKYNDLLGWTLANNLENIECENIFETNNENE
jgi:curved DNA-binding protein CbpA